MPVLVDYFTRGRHLLKWRHPFLVIDYIVPIIR